MIWEVRRASRAANRALCVCHCCLLHLGSQILVAQNLGPLDSQEDLSVSHCPVVATPSGNLHRFVHCRSCSTLVLSLCMCMIALPTFLLFTCFTIQHSSVFPRTFSSITPLVLGGMDRISSVEGLSNTVLGLSAFPDYIPYSSTHDISWYQRRLGVERSWRREYAIHPSLTLFPLPLIV